MQTDPHRAKPQVAELDVHTDTQVLPNWQPVLDLLSSHALDRVFAVETENDGGALLRFGDGQYGLDPPAGSHIFIQYRIGAGTAGKSGAETLGPATEPCTPLRFPSLPALRDTPAAGRAP